MNWSCINSTFSIFSFGLFSFRQIPAIHINKKDGKEQDTLLKLISMRILNIVSKVSELCNFDIVGFVQN
jgi:hypothetical protein